MNTTSAVRTLLERLQVVTRVANPYFADPLDIVSDLVGHLTGVRYKNRLLLQVLQADADHDPSIAERLRVVLQHNNTWDDERRVLRAWLLSSVIRTAGRRAANPTTLIPFAREMVESPTGYQPGDFPKGHDHGKDVANAYRGLGLHVALNFFDRGLAEQLLTWFPEGDDAKRLGTYARTVREVVRRLQHADRVVPVPHEAVAVPSEPRDATAHEDLRALLDHANERHWTVEDLLQPLATLVAFHLTLSTLARFGNGARRLPLVPDLVGTPGTPLARAAEVSYERIRGEVRETGRAELLQLLAESGSGITDAATWRDAVLASLRRTRREGGRLMSEPLSKDIKTVLADEVPDGAETPPGDERLHAVTTRLVDIFARKNQVVARYIEFLRQQGVASGLFGPRSPAARKRVMLEDDLLRVLAVCHLRAQRARSEEATVDTLVLALTERYGIVALREPWIEDALAARVRLEQLPHGEEIAANRAALEARLAELGLAERYSDMTVRLVEDGQ